MAGSSLWTLTRWHACLLIGLCATAIAVCQESADQDQFRQLYQELRNLMDDDLDDATAFLESKIDQAPDSIDRNVLRQSLASKLQENRDFDEAKNQLMRLLEFQIRRIDLRDNQLGVWMTMQELRNVASAKELAAAVDRGFDAITQVETDSPNQTLFPASQLAAMKAQVLSDAGDDVAAQKLVADYVQKLIELNRREDADEETAQALISMLRTLITSDDSNDPWRDECVKYLDTAVKSSLEKYPASVSLQNAYADTQLNMITRWGQDDPDATEERIELVSKQLESLATKNRSLRGILRRISAYKQRMDAAKPPETLVGKPSPEWDIDSWVDGVERTQDSFAGKVVLIDFWAVWCGPCIATFPHLREWREEFGEQGFEIVGVTQYYNFAWDDLNQRANRSDTPVDEDEERETLVKFLEHHQLEHPVFVTPKESDMSSEFGVRGIPHVVLVDQKGTVQLIKTGAGQQTADEVHAKIEELLEIKAN